MPLPRLFITVVRRTGVLFFLALAAWLVPLVVTFPIRFEFPIGRVHHITEAPLEYIVVFALFFQGLIWSKAIVTHWADTYIERQRANRDDASTIRVVALLVRIAVGALLFVIAFDALGKSITALITGLGIGGIAIAFALQNVLSDVFGAFSIAFDKPFIVGDAIAVDGLSGTVERIGLKSTRVRSDSGEQIVFANGELLKGRIRNYGRMQERQVLFVLEFDGNTPPDKLARIPGLIREIVSTQPRVRFARSNVTGIGDATYNVESVYYCLTPSYLVYVDVHQDILLALIRRFADEGIELAVQLEAAQKLKIAGRT